MVPSGIHELPNKPLEWKGPHPLSALKPQAPCLPLRGSVRRMVGRLGLSPLVSLLMWLVASLEGRLTAIWLNWMQVAREG